MPADLLRAAEAAMDTVPSRLLTSPPPSDYVYLIHPGRLVLYTVKKGLAGFPSPAGMSLIKLSLARKNLPINRLNNYLWKSGDFPRIY